MRRISLSVLSVFIAAHAWAGARLPVVNIASGSVSARTAFGEDVQKNSKSIAVVKSDATPVVASAQKAEVAQPKKKKLVARTATRPATPKKAATVSSVDSGEQIIASNDVLTPRRPSADLWAKNDAPLRMPSPDEFSVFRADFDLPEESLDNNYAATTAPARNVAPRPVVAATVKSDARPMSELDAQIAKLVELQRRADESVDATPSVAVATTPASTSLVENARDITPVQNIASAPEKTDNVKLSRMVVPMTQDVVVRTVEKNTSPRIAAVRDDMTKMSPTELRKAFRKTFLSENKHLSTYQIDDRFDVASDMSSSIEGFTAKRDLSESAGIRPLEIKIRFRNEDSALSRDNYNLLTEYASIVVSNPKRAIQVAIPQNVTRNADDRKLAARRLAIVEQVLRDTGVSEQRIMPVLSQRDEEGFVLRIISGDQYETLTQRQRNMFGDTVGKKTYKSMSW